jgi:L-aspartate oxidase
MDVDPLLIHSDRETIQAIMWNYTGIIRNRKRLKRALADLNYLNHRIESFYRDAPISSKLLELRNSLLTAYLITRAASSNPSSKGCHYLEE